jgi:hypothetical protein
LGAAFPVGHILQPLLLPRFHGMPAARPILLAHFKLIELGVADVERAGKRSAAAAVTTHRPVGLFLDLL